jgi:predicted metal-dependent peptidase
MTGAKVARHEARVEMAAIEARVLSARIRLALAHPFLAHPVMRLPLRPVRLADWCPTAATDGYHIFFNPDWIDSLDDAAIRGVLAHEVLHVIFAHAMRRDGRHPLTWNIACDYAINALLIEQGFVLPEGGLYREDCAGRTAEAIHRLIEGDRKQAEAVQNDPARGASARRRGPAMRPAGAPSASPARPPVEAGAETHGLNDCELAPVGHDLIDPDDPRARPYRTGDAPDREQLDDLCRELRADARSRLAGSGAQAFDSVCDAADAGRVDWRALLRHRLAERIKGDWTSYPFSKRHLHRGFFMPSPGMMVPGHIVFAIDTSGSMSDEVLAQVFGELRSFRETFPCEMTVIQADDRVRSVKRFEAMESAELVRRVELSGRGGTDFRSVFDWLHDQAPEALLIYATDGFGRFPEVEPPGAVIWLLTAERALRPAFGTVVDIGP